MNIPLHFASRLFATTLTLAAAASTAFGQGGLETPQASPRAVTSQKLGLTDITISYSRPHVSGRKVWGGLVPFGEVWRAGANLNTTIEFSSPVTIEGKPLAKGRYGLHLLPTADATTVIFSKTSTAWGSYTYDAKEDALRVEVKPVPAEMREALSYEFTDSQPTSVTVSLHWEKLAVPFKVGINDEETTLPHLRAQLRGSMQYTWDSWSNAASYCLSRKINLEEALRWTERSIQLEERFENLQGKADILKALGREKDAAAPQARALEIAPAPQLYTYARQMQGQKRGEEALVIFQAVAKRFPKDVFGLLAEARLASSKGDFVKALKDAQAAQAVTPIEPQKKAIQTLIDRLGKKEDINK